VHLRDECVRPTCGQAGARHVRRSRSAR
jgi:hypothetical protein